MFNMETFWTNGENIGLNNSLSSNSTTQDYSDIFTHVDCRIIEISFQYKRGLCSNCLTYLNLRLTRVVESTVLILIAPFMKIFLLLEMNGYKAILLSKDYARVICFDGLFEVKKMNIFVLNRIIFRHMLSRMTVLFKNKECII